MGSISKRGNIVNYSVFSVKDLINSIISHFMKYPLLSQKSADFSLFNSIVDLIINKFHHTIEGFNQTMNIKASMNKGLSQNIKHKFINIVFINRPFKVADKILGPQWITGFVNGKSTFDVKLYTLNTKTGHAIQLRFRIP